MNAREVAAFFRDPPALYRRAEVIGRGSAVPPEPGIYGWYFDELPEDLDFRTRPADQRFRLLYVGIAPGLPPRSNTAPSTLRKRLRTHASGNADASTLRFTLGCLLAASLGVSLRLTPSGRFRFGPGEAVLSDWMEIHARVAWVVHPEPWTIEREVVQALDLPLNRSHNQTHPFHQTLGALRASARRSAMPL